MKKKAIIWTVVVVVLVAGGIFAIKRAKQRDSSYPDAKVYPIVVSTMKPELKEETLTLPYLALAQNDEDVTLASRISARVEFIKPSGYEVKKGDIIAKLDDTGIRSNLNSAKAGLEAAEITLSNLEASHNRTLELVKVEGASVEQSEMEDSKIADLKSRIESLNQKLSELQNARTYAIVKSPVKGRISKTMVNVGDVIMPGHSIANINSTNGFYLTVSVPTNLRIYGVRFDNESYEAIPLKSTFNGLAEYKVYTESQNLTSGDRVEVEVEAYKGKAIKLPFDAILNRNGKSYVLIKDNDSAVAHEITVIQSGENGAVVNNREIAGKEIVVAKQDILLKLLAGVTIKLKEG